MATQDSSRLLSFHWSDPQDRRHTDGDYCGIDHCVVHQV